MKQPHEETRKITTNLLAGPLDDLLREGDEGITELLNRLILQEKNRLAWQAVADLRGKIKFADSYERTMNQVRDKEDRDLSKFLKPRS